MDNRIRRIGIIMLMLVMILLPTAAGSESYALGEVSLSEEQQNSSLGFFVWLSENADTAEERADAKAAVQILTNTISSANRDRIMNNGTIIGGSGSISYQDLLNATRIGAEYDATALDNLRQAIDFVSLGNDYRAKENRAPLSISSGLMAMAELNANYQDNHTLDHSAAFLAMENLAFRQIGGTWQYGNVGGALSDDPYEGWYTKEKENYDTNNGGQTGHYETLTDRQVKMATTGFGVRDRYITENLTASDGKTYTCKMHDRYYSQHFSDNAYMYDISAGVTPEKYLAYLNDYSCNTLGHQWSDWNVTTEATETNEGLKMRKCKVCGETESEVIPKLDHSLVKTEAVAATCTEPGNIEYWTCKECSKHFKDADGTQEIELDETIIGATGHQYGAWNVTREATTSETGTKEKVCTVCGNKVTEEIPKKDNQSQETPEKTQPEKDNPSEEPTEQSDKPVIIPDKPEETNVDKKDEAETADIEPLSIKSLWASQHSVGIVKFKWTGKDGVKAIGWNLKYRTRKIGGNNKWSGWTNKTYSADTYEAWINIKKDYVIEIHAQAVGDTTWSTGIITTPAGGKYQAMKTTHVVNTATKKNLPETKVAGSAIAHTDINLKVGQSIKVRPDYDYPVKDTKKRPRLYPSHMLYDIGDKSMITITKPDGSKYTGGIIDGAATIKATKAGKTTIVFRSPNGRTMIADVTITN